jgi:hypothetical protein
VSFPDANFELRSVAIFEPIRAQTLDHLFPQREVIDLRGEFKVDYLNDHHQFLKPLLDLLPFGQILSPTTYYHIIDDSFPQIVIEARRQLLYWHLARVRHFNQDPVDQFTLFNNEDYLWQRIVPSATRDIQFNLLEGDRIRFLTRFHLTYEKIEIAFDEIRLISLPESFRLAIADGREHTYNWNSTTWEITLINTDSSIIDPREYHYPPETRAPNLLPALDAYLDRQLTLERNLADAAETAWAINDSLPSSSIPTDFDEARWDHCICRKEDDICNCPYRPDTPPTPNSVVLWSPGNKYLPYRA